MGVVTMTYLGCLVRVIDLATGDWEWFLDGREIADDAAWSLLALDREMSDVA